MKESQQLPWPQNKQLEHNSMLSNLTFGQHRVHTMGVAVMLSAVMLCATPVFAQELRHVAEVMKTTSSGPASFGPVGALCSATTGGSGCKFLTVTGVGATGKIVEGDDAGDTFTSTGDVTLLFVFTPSGAHDASGDATGDCAPSPKIKDPYELAPGVRGEWRLGFPGTF